MINEQVDVFKKLLAQMSYYNAAESSWFDETPKRNKCWADVLDMAKNLKLKGIDVKGIAAGYLVDINKLDKI